MKDWCISRQLWWGHRVPVYYIDGTDEFVVARNEEEALIQAQRKFGPGVTITQDEDVLDTWFRCILTLQRREFCVLGGLACSFCCS